MEQMPKTGRAALNRREFTHALQSYLSPLTPEDKLIEINFLINNTIKDERDDISTQIINLKKAEKEAQKKPETSILKSIKDSNKSSFAKFDEFLKNKSNGGYNKSIITRKKHKKNYKSFRRKSNKNC